MGKNRSGLVRSELKYIIRGEREKETYMRHGSGTKTSLSLNQNFQLLSTQASLDLRIRFYFYLLFCFYHSIGTNYCHKIKI